MSEISAFGFELDTSTFAWSWTLSRPNSILFHFLLCLFYFLSTLLVKRFVTTQPKYTPPAWLERKSMHTLRIIYYFFFALATKVEITVGCFALLAHRSSQFSGLYALRILCAKFLPRQRLIRRCYRHCCLVSLPDNFLVHLLLFL